MVGLEKYGVDLDVAAGSLKGALGCACRVQSTPKASGGETYALVAQGARESSLADFVVKAVGVPRAVVHVAQAKGVKERAKDVKRALASNAHV